jgi:hypothetical protein
LFTPSAAANTSVLGLGRLDFLRHIAMREVPVPPHITILFVEQELKCDTSHLYYLPTCLQESGTPGEPEAEAGGMSQNWEVT